MKQFRILLALFGFILLNYTAYPQNTWQDIYVTQPNVANCQAGEMTTTEKQKLLTLINKIRKIHKMSELSYEFAGDNAAMEASLIMTANGSITHFPPETFFCYSPAGANGAETSNLHVGINSAEQLGDSEDALVGWLIDDQSQSGDQLGHRRAIINPFLNKVAFGRVDGHPKDPQSASWFFTAMAMKYQDYVGTTANNFEMDYVAYPFENYPIDFFAKDFYLSFTAVPNKNSLWANADVDFSSAQITMQADGGSPLTISNQKFDNDGWGSLPNNLQWKAAGLQNEVKYLVTINNVKYNGETYNYSYWFKLTNEELPETLSTPVLSSPQNNSVDLVNDVDFSWNAVANALSYNIQVSKVQDFSTFIHDASVATNSWSVTLEKGKTFYWRVKAFKNELESEFSEIFTFSTEAIQEISAPLLTAPADNITDFEPKGRIIWKITDGVDIVYHLQISSNIDFTGTFAVDKDNLTSVFYDLGDGELSPSTKYYWRVKAYNTETSSDWSEVRNLTTAAQSSVFEQINNLLTVYPNPADDYINIQLPENTQGSALVNIYSMDGILVTSLESEASNNTVRFELTNILAGKYFAGIEINGSIYYSSFEVIK